MNQAKIVGKLPPEIGPGDYHSDGLLGAAIIIALAVMVCFLAWKWPKKPQPRKELPNLEKTFFQKLDDWWDSLFESPDPWQKK